MERDILIELLHLIKENKQSSFTDIDFVDFIYREEKDEAPKLIWPEDFNLDDKEKLRSQVVSAFIQTAQEHGEYNLFLDYAYHASSMLVMAAFVSDGIPNYLETGDNEALVQSLVRLEWLVQSNREEVFERNGLPKFYYKLFGQEVETLKAAVNQVRLWLEELKCNVEDETLEDHDHPTFYIEAVVKKEARLRKALEKAKRNKKIRKKKPLTTKELKEIVSIVEKLTPASFELRFKSNGKQNRIPKFLVILIELLYITISPECDTHHAYQLVLKLKEYGTQSETNRDTGGGKQRKSVAATLYDRIAQDVLALLRESNKANDKNLGAAAILDFLKEEVFGKEDPDTPNPSLENLRKTISFQFGKRRNWKSTKVVFHRVKKGPIGAEPFGEEISKRIKELL